LNSSLSKTEKAMVTIREKTTIKMRMEGKVQSHARTDVSVRGLTNVIDEPLERGGTNMGMSPTETFAASLVGCTSVISHKIAHRMGIHSRTWRSSWRRISTAVA
jgi:putative redox protein